MTRERPRHGTPGAYSNGCRCDVCHSAHRSRCKSYQARAHSRGGSTTTDADRAAKVLAELAERMSLSAIGRAIGTSHTYVAKVIRGDIKRIAHEREAVILRLGNYRPADTSHVSPRAAIWMLRALHRIGYTWRRLAEEIDGYSLTAIKTLARGEFPVIEAENEAAIRAAYERLSMRLPVGATPHERGAIAAAVKRGESRNWPPPLALDDDRLDDPDYCPVGWEYVPATRAEQVAELVDRGASISEACRVLHLSREALQRWCQRHGMSREYLALTAPERQRPNQFTEGVA